MTKKRTRIINFMNTVMIDSYGTMFIDDRQKVSVFKNDSGCFNVYLNGLYRGKANTEEELSEMIIDI